MVSDKWLMFYQTTMIQKQNLLQFVDLLLLNDTLEDCLGLVHDKMRIAILGQCIDFKTFYLVC